MSKVLSIYNTWGFCEVVLPASPNTDYSFLLDASLFHLSQNRVVRLSCNQKAWRFDCTDDGFSVTAKANGDAIDPMLIHDNARFDLVTPDGEYLYVLSEDRDNPLQVYGKFDLSADHDVSIGAAADNDICYNFPYYGEKQRFVSGHHCLIHFDGTVAQLEDISKNGVYINNIRVQGRQQLHFGDHIRIYGLSLVSLGTTMAIYAPAGLTCHLSLLNTDDLKMRAVIPMGSGKIGRTVFYRSPRFIPKMNTETITIDPPPQAPDQTKVPIWMQIGPAMTMVIPMALGSGVSILAARSGGGNASILMFSGIFTAAASAVIGTFWAAMNIHFQRKTTREKTVARFEKYGNYLLEMQKKTEKVYAEDEKAIREKYPAADVVATYDAGNGKLWERNFNHTDVLDYRVGLGDVPFPAAIEVQKQRFSMIDDALSEKPQMIRNSCSMMHDVPVCVDFRQHDIIGIIGENNRWASIVRDLIVQIAGSNSYTDVKIALVYDKERISDPHGWDFVKWLPHVWSEDHKTRYYATGKNEANEVFFALSDLLRTRTEEKREKAGVTPYILLFVLNKELLEGELIGKYISNTSSEIGLTAIIAADRYDSLPNRCEYIIENNEDFAGVYNPVDETSEKESVVFDTVSVSDAERFAKNLSNIQVLEGETGGEVPNSVTFFEMYGVDRPEEFRSAERWRKSKITESMRALIGLTYGPKPCYLDIHERYHGPHGLVAGTTGSGKSETLQTYLLSLALNFSPDDVVFFIIDYKGGGMANLFTGLPHLIGAISNLSGNQINRALVSIKSENKRRQRMFAEYGVNNINGYTKLYKNGDTKEPIPHLLIIIDEFAELKKEQPDFMRELVSVAQVGRSLGVHLILSTQKPAGTVDDNIWSNSKFKLCLRVQDTQDSMDMLHRKDAAYITQAGRGYLQVGNDEIFELFQSGYSGAPYDADAAGKLMIAQMLDSVGKLDLVGNHIKVRHQQEVALRWNTVLLTADLAAARAEARKRGESVETMLPQDPVQIAGELVTLSGSNTPGLWSDESLVENVLLPAMYESIKKSGQDFREEPANSARLVEYGRLVAELLYEKNASFAGNPIDTIVSEAHTRGVRMPEVKVKTQLEAVCEYLAGVAKENGYNHKLTLWMPVLPRKMTLTQVDGYVDAQIEQTDEERPWDLSVIIGKGDDPANQNQMPITLDFVNGGHHLICGSVSTGKSTFLQTLVYALINRYTSEEINLYLIDFSAKLLTVFADAPQVGGVMTDAEADVEKISKFFMMMDQIMQERKKTLSSTTYRDYMEHSGGNLPAVFVVIDNYASFKEKTQEKYSDAIKYYTKEGLTFGIYIIMTSGGISSAEVPSRLADNFRTTLCLEMPDVYQYGEVMRVVRVPLYPEANTPGRGLVNYNGKIIEFQTAIACGGTSIFDRNANIQKRIERIKAFEDAHHLRAARRIPMIPENPTWEIYTGTDDYEKLIHTPDLVPNGYNRRTATYSSYSLVSMLTYLITGTRKSGKSTYMKNLITACHDRGDLVVIVELGTTEYASVAKKTDSLYVTDGQGIYDMTKDVILKNVKERGDTKVDGLNRALSDEEFFESMKEYQKIQIFIAQPLAFLKEIATTSSPANGARAVLEMMVGDKGYHYNMYFYTEIRDEDVDEASVHPFFKAFRNNGVGIRFGGKFANQHVYTFANIPYRLQPNPLPAGIGVVPCEEPTAPLEEIVVPDCR